MKSLIDKGYLELQKEIASLQDEVQQTWEGKVWEVSQTNKADEPTVLHAKWLLPESVYQDVLFRLLLRVENHQPDLRLLFERVREILTLEVCTRFREEAIRSNYIYFEKFASDHQVPEWIPQFFAEHALRPFLRTLAMKKEGKNYASCPCCGEPVRLALLDEKGKRENVCPRCFTSWQVRKLSCSHCGQEKHEEIRILTIEGESQNQLLICQDCNGYVKIVDSAQMLSQVRLDLLDLNTIHLDYIAQDRGYGTTYSEKAYV